MALYVDPNYGGLCIVKEIGDYSDPNAINLPNDSISSVKVGARVKAWLCRDSGLGNTCEWFDYNDPDLANNSVNTDMVSSVRVISRGGIALCDNTGGGGECHWYGSGDTGENNYNMSDQGFDNRAESVVYDSAYAGLYHIVLYTEQNQTGYLYHADNSVNDLGSPYDNNISSIKIYKHQPSSATIVSPADGTKFPSTTTDVDLRADGGDSSRVHVWNNSYNFNGDWQSGHTQHLGGLTPGRYYWQAQAQNVAGAGAWTDVTSFTINTPPRVLGGLLTVDSGTSHSVEVDAVDDEQDSLTLTASNLPSFVTFTDNHDGTATLTVNPSVSAGGSYTITAAASDGELTGSGTVQLNVTTPKTSAVTDDWSSGNIDGAKWNNWNSSQVTAGNNKLTITTLPSAGYYGLDTGGSGAVQDMTDSSATNELVNAGNQSLSTFEVFPVNIVKADANDNQLQFYVSHSTVIARKQIGGAYTVMQTAPYSPAQDKFFKIRESGGNIYWETSADGQQWTGFASIAAPFDISKVVVSQSAGTWQPEAATTSAQFDNFNIIPVAAPATAFSDNWSSGGIAAKWNDWSGGHASVANSQLKLSSVAGGGYFGIDSGTAGKVYDLTDSSVQNLLVDTGNRSLGSWEIYPTSIFKDSDTRYALHFFVSGDTIFARSSTPSGFVNLKTAAYNPLQQRYFRISESNGTVYWDTSADGYVWTNFTSAPKPFDLTAVRLGVMVGTWQAEAATTSATFDDFNIVRTVPPISTPKENWSSGAISDSTWNNWSGGHLSVVNQQLQASSTTSPGYYGISSSGRYDLTNSSVTNQVVNAGNQNLASFEVYPLNLGPDNNNQISWYVGGYNIVAKKKIAGTQTTLRSVPYNPAIHKYFRIREAGGSVYWDYSTDGSTWTNFTSLAAWPFDLTYVDIGQMIGTWQAESATTSAAFDNLNVIPALPPAASLADDWSSGSISSNRWYNWGGSQIGTVNGQLQLTSTPTANYFGVVSANKYDLTGSSVTDQVVDAGNQNLASFEVYPVNIGKDSDNQLSWFISHNMIFAKKKIATAQTILMSAAYDPSTQKYFRIKENGGVIYWDYSANGTTWTNFTSLSTAPFDITSVNVEQMIGSWASEASTTSAVLDNFNVLP